MNCFVRRLLVICLALLATATLAAEPRRNLGVAAEKRVALVIGNGKYAGNALKNPANDARDMAAALRKIGFDVIEKTDVTQKEMNRAITQFGAKLTADTVALFFYAGHGMQVKGKNYLIPIDAQIENEASVRAETVDVDTVLDQLSASPLNVVILDACRNNPFERRFRGTGGGLAQMDAPKGTLIAYATSPGKVASDGDGRNGLYTQELLKVIQTPGLEVEKAFKRVRANVARATGDNQIPWEASSLTGEFSFSRGESAPGPVAAATRVQSDAELEQEFWDSVKNSSDADAFQSYLAQYPQGRFATLAKVKLKELAKPLQVAIGTAPGSLPANSAEATPLGKTFQDCADCPEMVTVPAGSFQMGSNGYGEEKPVHTVTIRLPYALGKTEVTQKQWKAVMGNNPSKHHTGWFSSDSSCEDCPVENVSWNEVQDFVRKLSQKTGKTYRLPSEAEWEYACRAGGTHTYCGSDNIDSVAWYTSNSGSKTHAVAGKQANAWGLYDMSGNVWEWTEDCWNGNYNGAPTDGSAWTSGECGKRVLRGGSWYDIPQFARSAWRGMRDAAIRSHVLGGFRPARTLF